MTREEQNSTRLVQMKLRPKTIERLDELHEITGIDNRTQIVAAAIQLTHFLAHVQEKGGRLLVEHSDGRTEVVAIVGL